MENENKNSPKNMKICGFYQNRQNDSYKKFEDYKGMFYIGWTEYFDMLDSLKEYWRTRNIYFNETDKKRKY